MKNLTGLLVVSIFMLTSLHTNAQKHHKHRGHAVQQLTSYTGVLTEWNVNHDFAYDGFYLNASGSNIFVKFPKHMGMEITTAVSKGENLTVKGYMKTNRHGETYFKMSSIQASGRTIYDVPRPKHVPKHRETFTQGSGVISSTQTDNFGQIHGFVLSDGTILRIPKHKAYQVVNIAPVGSSIEYSGLLHEDKFGHAYSKNVKVVHPLNISVNGVHYRVK